jgi:exopolyphosphatase / guanosine-5'-triphosphate,3'-diphosphate pyrophosphatase
MPIDAAATCLNNNHSMDATAPRTFAAIDMGSNGVRLFIGRVFRGGIQVLRDRRVPIRLGEEAFRHRRISPTLTNRLVQCFREFREETQAHGALHLRAVATSALRDARNGNEVVAQIWRHTGIKIEIIDGLEEAHLLHLAVQRSLSLGKQKALLMDIGGGSLETVLAHGPRLRKAMSLKLGTVRLLERCGTDASYATYASQVRRELDRLIDGCDLYQDLIRPDLLIGTGGNLRALTRLWSRLYHRPLKSHIGIQELESLTETLFSHSVRQRRLHLGLKRDRADVIRPASTIALEIMRAFNFAQLMVPNVGIKNGVFWRLAETVNPHTKNRKSDPRTFADSQRYMSGPDL